MNVEFYYKSDILKYFKLMKITEFKKHIDTTKGFYLHNIDESWINLSAFQWKTNLKYGEDFFIETLCATLAHESAHREVPRHTLEGEELMCQLFAGQCI